MKNTLLLVTLFLFISIPSTHAGMGWPDPSLLANPNSFVDASVMNAFVQSVGFATEHRSYRPATPLGTFVGLDASVEVTIAKIPTELWDALNTLNTKAGGTTPIKSDLSILPLPRAHLHKGLGPMAEVGLSAIGYRGYRIIGGDFKLTVYQPEEGPWVALQMNYTQSKIDIIQTSTYAPQIVISKPMDFADPFIGAGLQYSFGSVSVPITVNIPMIGNITETLSGSGRAQGAEVFGGILIKIPLVGIQLTLAGSYSSAGVHSMGIKTGLLF